MQELFNEYPKTILLKNIKNTTEKLIKTSQVEMTDSNLKTLVSLIDLTSLNVDDNEKKIQDLCLKVNLFNEAFPSVPNVAAICVYPSLIPVVFSNLNSRKVRIASVAGGFPASLTFIEIKKREIELAVEAGADEIDIVLPVGKFIEKKYKDVHDEITQLKEAAGKAELKVILETGALSGYESVRNASLIAMDAGADFIKTSTGKIPQAATPDKFLVMVEAIKDFHNKTQKMVGIKAAGGISTPEDALIYFTIVKNVLGEKWLNNKYFRIGASRLLSNLLDKIQELS